MTYRSKIIVTVVLLVFLGGLGIADLLFSRDNLAATIPLPEGRQNVSSLANTSASSGPGVAKRKAANIEDTLKKMGYTLKLSTDLSMIGQVVGTTVPVNALTILKDNDRIGAVVWIESPEVKTTFNSLKDALLATFSPQVKDLEDTTKIDPGMPIRNVLTFLDPSLSEERLTFVRVGERFLEFHSVVGKEDAMSKAIESLSTL